jgi:hypothetical protein
MGYRVRLWMDSYAPGMIQALPVRKDIIDQLSPPDAQERTALLNFADVQLSPAQRLDIEEGSHAEIIVEWEELSAWYGGAE